MCFFLMIRRPPRSTLDRSSAASDVYKRQVLRHYIDFARENPNLYRLAWVMPEIGIESSEENRLRTLNTVGHLASLLKLGMEAGVFENREPLLAAGTALAMMNTPFILFHNGRLADPIMRDRVVEEVFSATMGYLKKK